MDIKKIILIFSGLGIALIFGGVVASQKWVEKNLLKIKHNPTAVQKILDTHAEITQISAFQPMGEDHNAGVILNPHIALDDGSEAQSVVWWTHYEQNALIRENWLESPETLLDSNGIPLFDDSILEKLLIYDHWKTETSGAYGETLKKPPIKPFSEAPTPILIGIQPLVKARLSRGLTEKNMIPALTEVRHLARLTLGHDNIIDSMIAIALLNIERSAAEKAIEMGMMTVNEWEVVPQEKTDLAKSLIWASINLYDHTAEDTAAPFLQQNEIFEKCTILAEAGFRLHATKSFFKKPRWPYEADIFTGLEQFEKDWEQSGCELPGVTRYWNSGLDFIVIPEEERFLMQIPYYRMVIASTLISLGMNADASSDDPFELY